MDALHTVRTGRLLVAQVQRGLLAAARHTLAIWLGRDVCCIVVYVELLMTISAHKLIWASQRMLGWLCDAKASLAGTLIVWLNLTHVIQLA